MTATGRLLTPGDAQKLQENTMKEFVHRERLFKAIKSEFAKMGSKHFVLHKVEKHALQLLMNQHDRCVDEGSDCQMKCSALLSICFDGDLMPCCYLSARAWALNLQRELYGVQKEEYKEMSPNLLRALELEAKAKEVSKKLRGKLSVRFADEVKVKYYDPENPRMKPFLKKEMSLSETIHRKVQMQNLHLRLQAEARKISFEKKSYRKMSAQQRHEETIKENVRLFEMLEFQ